MRSSATLIGRDIAPPDVGRHLIGKLDGHARLARPSVDGELILNFLSTSLPSVVPRVPLALL